MQAHPTPSTSPVVQAQSAQRTDTEALAAATDPRRHQLIVRPIVKTTFSQREQSGKQLDDVALNGSTFKDILKKIWERFSPRVKGQAVKRDGAWAVEVPTIEAWSKVMQIDILFYYTKTNLAWDRWLTSTQGETVLLLVYEFGVAIGKDSDLKEFKNACITPTSTDRSGATAELCLQDVVSRLQAHWESTFQCSAAVGGCGETTLPGI
ncbi:hypothetical protein PHMEG_00041572 [Phytophthora megakarya]|uniref:Uncharacterized protein n=1 Tax=Phytophthora megakarya TaxID=4795 RepID=A0A225UBL7_9STRA|nr:hypothetical protein PHMEG_00041572 [Phytophthora megakarya]